MNRMEDWALAYVVNALWQIPLVFAGAWLAARLASRMGPRAEHRVWVCSLLAQIALPACPARPTEIWHMVTRLLGFGAARGGGDTRVLFGPAAGLASGWLHLPRFLAAVLLLACAGAALYCIARLAWGLVRMRRILRHADPVDLHGDLAQSWRGSCAVFAARVHPRMFAPSIASSTLISGPVTAGASSLLVPEGFLARMSATEFDTLLAHEFAHIERRDFLKNLAYGLVSLPVVWHPALALTRASMAETRERVCDALAADAIAGPVRYARSLLRLASMLSTAAPAGALHALGIFDSNHLERRIMNLTGKRSQIHGARRLIVLTACVALGAAACTSALALRVAVDDQAKSAKIPTHVDVKNLKLIYKVPPEYPAQAKADRLSGTVILNVVVGKDGSVENIQVEKSLREDCDQSAIDAVRQWKFAPVLVNNEPIEVKTTIEIHYSLKK